LIDASGHKVWDFKADDQLWDLKPAPSAVDKIGHIFINYDPGRYNGVIVLGPIGHGFDDFGSFPSGSDPASWRFYDAVASDTDGNGTFVIDVSQQSCVPDCASGGITHVLFRWDGSEYVKS